METEAIERVSRNGDCSRHRLTTRAAVVVSPLAAVHSLRAAAPLSHILGNLYVTYAKQDEAAQRDVPGPGLGFVNVFDANGHLIRRFASRGGLNAPWGVALAPADFGRFSNTLLIGNFGDGRINAFDVRSGDPRGQLRTPDGHPITIDGLWGIAFGNGVLNQATNTLFFAAGPGEEQHGLYGRINAVQKDDNDE